MEPSQAESLEVPNRLNLMIVNRPFAVSKAAYFFYFAAAASLMPFLTLYYQELGLSGRQIGFASGIVPLITLISASLWGGIADASRRHHALLLLAIGGTWLAVLALTQAETFAQLIPVIVVYAVFTAPVVPLIDNTVMDLLGEHKNQYGKLRLWGAIGWGIVASVIGLVIERTGLRWGFYSYLVFMLGLGITAYFLPVKPVQIAGKFWQGLRLLLANRHWLLFLLVVLIQGMSLSIFLNFLFLHLEDMGASRALMGLSLTVATVSELPFWFYSDRLLDKWGSRRLLMFSLVMYLVRAFAYALMWQPWLVLPISLLHGPSFSAMWAAGVAYAAETAPEGLGATAQALFASTSFGLGGMMGGFVGGWLYEDLGGSLMYMWVGIGLSLGWVFFVLANRMPSLRTA
jgi:PPP family 3-phenylpropionic acid transporter